MGIIRQVQIFGDSILKGVMLDSNSKRYYFSKEDNIEELEKILPVSIKNNSKFGSTIEYGSKQLQGFLDKGLRCDIALIEYGGNDCDYNWDEVSDNPGGEHYPNTPPRLFEETFRFMLEKIKNAGIRPLVMSLPPVDAQRYFKWITRKGQSKANILKFLGDIEHIYRFQELYSNIATKVAYETGSLFVDVRNSFLLSRDFKAMICDDGIHPNAEGHKLINQAFVDFARLYNKNSKYRPV
jgi:lysophospholipase L1-like esterase